MGGKGSGGYRKEAINPKKLGRQVQFFLDKELTEWLNSRNRSFNLSNVLRDLLHIFKDCNEDLNVVKEKVKNS